ncbi:MAG TPA: amidohydrolase family protein [Gemmatimonadales bacterium]|nr:amidohydrolase family protein [Gemmatimonadales bacterium]
MKASRVAASLLALLCAPATARAQAATPHHPLVIDMHLHALAADFAGPPPASICAPIDRFEPQDAGQPRQPWPVSCTQKLTSPPTDSALLRRTLDQLERWNVLGVTSGPIAYVRRWHAAAPQRVVPALLTGGSVALDSIRAWAADSTIRVLGELTFQYVGISPADSIAEAHFALAEQLDLPVGIHMALGPPGVAYTESPRYRVRLGDPLLLEETLIRHPHLRIYVMHAGFPRLESMLALLEAHPQVYVDIAVIDWLVPRAQFYDYLRRLVEAGFEQRIMFGSDEMIWPDALPKAITAVEQAPFLTATQKRDILCVNAARFLRLQAAICR